MLGVLTRLRVNVGQSGAIGQCIAYTGTLDTDPNAGPSQRQMRDF